MELTSHDRERDSCAGLECSFTVFMLLKKKKKWFCCPFLVSQKQWEADCIHQLHIISLSMEVVWSVFRN